jgi:hypothetical protein
MLPAKKKAFQGAGIELFSRGGVTDHQMPAGGVAPACAGFIP